MLNFAKAPIVAIALILYGYVPLVSGGSVTSSRLAAALEESLPNLIIAEDHRGASNAALQLASTRSASACAALQQSLDNYRKALTKESGTDEPAVSRVNDDSDGMADLRARFGCAKE